MQSHLLFDGLMNAALHGKFAGEQAMMVAAFDEWDEVRKLEFVSEMRRYCTAFGEDKVRLDTFIRDILKVP